MPDLINQRMTLATMVGILIVSVTAVATAAGWCSSVTYKLNDLATKIEAAGIDRYTAHDAARDIKDRDAKDADLQRQVNDLREALARPH